MTKFFSIILKDLKNHTLSTSHQDRSGSIEICEFSGTRLKNISGNILNNEHYE